MVGSAKGALMGTLSEGRAGDGAGAATGDGAG
jgi:hypothetical protein